MVGLAEVRAAAARLEGAVLHTPLLPAPALHDKLYLKAESLQRTGSFKVRGAFNRMRLLTPAERRRGVVAASAGNHAQGVALAAREMGVRAIIVMPEGAPLTKLEATRRLGADVVQEGTSFDQSFVRAQQLAQDQGLVLIHAFDDDAVIAGQGTVALEVLADLPEAGCLAVPIGGGGLAAGVAAAARAQSPGIRIYGVAAAGSDAMAASLRLGHPVGIPAVRTIADGLAVRQPAARTFEMISALVDDVIVVDEDDIAWAMLMLLERARLVAEGAGAVAVAALLAGRLPPHPGPTVAIVSGGNVDVTALNQIIARGLLRAGRHVKLRTKVADRPGALAGLLGIIAATGANLISVEHDRLRHGLPLDETDIALLIETRGPEHTGELRERLQAAGYAFHPEGTEGHLQ